MTIQEIAQLFRQYVDEPTKSFLTDDDVRLYLKMGYDQYREIASQCDPKIFQSIFDLGVFSGQNQIDLSTNPMITGLPSLLGSVAFQNNRGLLKIFEVINYTGTVGSPTMNVVYVMRGAASFNELYIPTMMMAPSYLLVDKTLMFSQPIAGSLAIYGMKQQDTTLWVNLNATTYPDDLVSYHDIIALLAYRHYAIRDGALAPATEQQMAQRINDFKEYLMYGRQVRASNHVLQEQYDNYFY